MQSDAVRCGAVQCSGMRCVWICRGLGIRAPGKCYSGFSTMELRSSTIYILPSFGPIQFHSLNYHLVGYYLLVVLHLASNSNPRGDPDLPDLSTRVPLGHRPACLPRSIPTLGPVLLASRCSCSCKRILRYPNCLPSPNEIFPYSFPCGRSVLYRRRHDTDVGMIPTSV